MKISLTTIPQKLSGGFKIGMALFLMGSVASFGCSNKNDASEYPADNSGKNKNDKVDVKVTPPDQKENQEDLNITQKIRQAIVADDSISMNGKNVKIITMNGEVTLRGPVDNFAEKENIGLKANQVAGVKKVDNQLDVIK